jgi:Bromodomain
MHDLKFGHRWNNRHLAPSPAQKVRSRKPTAFLRPSDEPANTHKRDESTPHKRGALRHRKNSANKTKEEDDATTNTTTTSANKEEDSDVEVDGSENVNPTQDKTDSTTRTKHAKQRGDRAKQSKQPAVPPDSSLSEPSAAASAKEESEEVEETKVGPKKKGKRSSKPRKGKNQNEKEKKEESDGDATLQSKIEKLFTSLYSAKDEEGELKCSHFKNLLEKANFGNVKDWKKYKQVVKSPICLEDIRKQTNDYTSAEELAKDFAKLIKNAKKVNSEVINCLEHVDWLEQFYLTSVATF